MKYLYLILLVPFFTSASTFPECLTSKFDNNINSEKINAHGGYIVQSNSKYYWFGEIKGSGSEGNKSHTGVSVYSSTDLCHWQDDGIAYSVKQNDNAIYLERPKVIYNKKNNNYVMWFHIDFKKGYSGDSYARLGVATSQKIEGPYEFKYSFRPNANSTILNGDFDYKEKSKFNKEIINGFDSRDFTLFKDSDNRAYVIYNSESNNTLHVSELNSNYIGLKNKYSRIIINGRNEAPVIFKKNGYYYLITSRLTGWKPNAARLFISKNINGPWELKYNPVFSNPIDVATTFQSQLSCVFIKNNVFYFIADGWVPNNPSNSRYKILKAAFIDDDLRLLNVKSIN